MIADEWGCGTGSSQSGREVLWIRDGVLHEASQSVFHEACQPFLHEACQLCTMVVNILHEDCQRSLARWLSRNGVWHDGCQKGGGFSALLPVRLVDCNEVVFLEKVDVLMVGAVHINKCKK